MRSTARTQYVVHAVHRTRYNATYRNIRIVAALHYLRSVVSCVAAVYSTMFADDAGGSSGPQVLEAFKFNFAVDGQQDDISDLSNEHSTTRTTTLHQPSPSSTPDQSSLITGLQHYPDDPVACSTRLFAVSPVSHTAPRLSITPTFSPYKLPPPAISSSDLASITRHSDVVRSVYEGGYKLWECAIDLCRHLQRLRDSGAPLDCRTVLELGCGHGLCGLWALLQGGAQHVIFHDLNPEVITDLTLPTIALNIKHLRYNQPLQDESALAELSQHTAFLSGDWSSPSLLALLPLNSHTLILTSDTLYHTASIAPLLHVIQHSLAANGMALIASKRYYFGVGGGTVELMRWVECDGRMVCDVVEVLEDGQSNIREVVRLRWKDGRIQRDNSTREADIGAMTDQ